MKNKTTQRILSLLLALALTCLVFVGCDESSKNGFVTIVLEGEPAVEYRVNLDKVEGNDGLLSVLTYLKAEEGLEYQTDPTGFLMQVGNVKQDTLAGVYVYIWTSVAADADVSEYAITKEYGDMTLTSAGVGAKDMTLTDGAVIYIGTIAW